MKIKIFSFEEMLKNGCFMMTMLNGNNEDQKILFYDGEEKIKSEEQYVAIEEDEDKIEFQMHAWECFYEDELPYVPHGQIIEIDDKFYNDESQDWLLIESGIGTLQIPRLPGVIYEEC